MFVDINNNKQELELHKNCAAIHTWKSFKWTKANKLSSINLIDTYLSFIIASNLFISIIRCINF